MAPGPGQLVELLGNRPRPRFRTKPQTLHDVQLYTSASTSPKFCHQTTSLILATPFFCDELKIRGGESPIFVSASLELRTWLGSVADGYRRVSGAA